MLSSQAGYRLPSACLACLSYTLAAAAGRELIESAERRMTSTSIPVYGVKWCYRGYIFVLSGLPNPSENVQFTRCLFLVRVRIYIDGTLVFFFVFTLIQWIGTSGLTMASGPMTPDFRLSATVSLRLMIAADNRLYPRRCNSVTQYDG